MGRYRAGVTHEDRTSFQNRRDSPPSISMLIKHRGDALHRTIWSSTARLLAAGFSWTRRSRSDICLKSGLCRTAAMLLTVTWWLQTTLGLNAYTRSCKQLRQFESHIPTITVNYSTNKVFSVFIAVAWWRLLMADIPFHLGSRTVSATIFSLLTTETQNWLNLQFK